MKIITDAFKTPNPTAVLLNQWQKDNAYYVSFMSASVTLAKEIMGAIGLMF